MSQNGSVGGSDQSQTFGKRPRSTQIHGEHALKHGPAQFKAAQLEGSRGTSGSPGGSAVALEGLVPLSVPWSLRAIVFASLSGSTQFPPHSFFLN